MTKSAEAVAIATTADNSAGPLIELAMPPAENRMWGDRRKGAEFFDRGERIIMVNGERWGRTHVKWHGVHGTTTHIQQEGGEILMRNPADIETWKEYKWLSVSSGGRRGRHEPNLKPIDELVIDKIRELIAAGRLRHPATIRAESEREMALDRAERAQAKEREAAEFRAKALEAAGYTGEPNDPESVAMVERIIGAMRWAQTK